jgi:hypothetical protein
MHDPSRRPRRRSCAGPGLIGVVGDAALQALRSGIGVCTVGNCRQMIQMNCSKTMKLMETGAGGGGVSAPGFGCDGAPRSCGCDVMVMCGGTAALQSFPTAAGGGTATYNRSAPAPRCGPHSGQNSRLALLQQNRNVCRCRIYTYPSM